ncbi:PaaI family thioesterase [Aliiruegeria sabulilitoris]|uniref:PaaI family thioesterase n=1 Tax=Aliiruegeria sabulilitoris TaxID=1510458 RepID=UPI000829A1D5|nr:PaaI family thioesterase [Aliiruegeria sabulilitoris]NDR55962.1 PaaI family thioesterase [Pseudoruegeria sp. M32A2M]
MEKNTLSPSEVDRIRKSFAAQSLMRTFGAELGEIAPGRVEITAPILPGALQQHGYAHAGLTFSLGDSAAGYAALSMMPEGAEVMSVEVKINLLAPAEGDRLIAIGKVVKPGRRLVVVSAEVFADNVGTRKQVALLQGTMIPV